MPENPEWYSSASWSLPELSREASRVQRKPFSSGFLMILGERLYSSGIDGSRGHDPETSLGIEVPI